MAYMVISKARRGTWGTGYEIRVDGYPACTYLGYSAREAEARYRAEHGLQRRRFIKVQY